MVKKILLLSLLFNLVGCPDNSEVILTEDIVKELLDKKVNTDCYYTTMDIVPAVQYNTTYRYLDKEKDEMVNDPLRDVITISSDSSDNKVYKMEVLEKIGLFSKINDKIFIGSKGITGYFVDPIALKENEGDEEFKEKTREEHGAQYRLTNKGKDETYRVNKTSDILFCLGKVRIDNFKIHPLNSAGEGRTKVTFTTRVEGKPDWLDDKEVSVAFPKLITEYGAIPSKTRGAVYIILNNRNEFIIENDMVHNY